MDTRTVYTICPEFGAAARVFCPKPDAGGRPGTMPGYPSWVVLHLPHDARDIPAEVRDQFLLDDRELGREVLRMTDHRTADLFGAPRAAGRVARAPVSRLVVDVERFENDALEPMAAAGMGAVYTHTSTCRPLRRTLDPSEREALLERWYRPHHRRLEQLVEDALRQHGRAVVLDAHSFPSRPLPYERAASSDRPDICIGTDPFHTPAALRDAFVNAFASEGFRVAVDTPFSGALVPVRYYRRDPRVQSVMVEVNRRLYLDEATGLPAKGFAEVAAAVQACCIAVLDGL
jgi:N-formylglutamate deformylase